MPYYTTSTAVPHTRMQECKAELLRKQRPAGKVHLSRQYLYDASIPSNFMQFQHGNREVVWNLIPIFSQWHITRTSNGWFTFSAWKTGTRVTSTRFLYFCCRIYNQWRSKWDLSARQPIWRQNVLRKLWKHPPPGHTHLEDILEMQDRSHLSKSSPLNGRTPCLSEVNFHICSLPFHAFP